MKINYLRENVSLAKINLSTEINSAMSRIGIYWTENIAMRMDRWDCTRKNEVRTPLVYKVHKPAMNI